MIEKLRQGTYKPFVRNALLILTCFAAIKLIFFGIERDETYAISLAYRLVQGDKLLSEMWEAHQTSSLLAAMLIHLYVALTGTTTAIVLYLRVVSVCINVLVAYAIYRVMKNYAREEICFLGALIYFNVAPKDYLLPDFSCNQVWSVTLLALCLIQFERYYGGIRAYIYICLSGVLMCYVVLSYPGCIIMFPFILYGLFISRKDKKPLLIFAGICLIGATVFVVYLLSYMDISRIAESVRFVLFSDATHETGENGALKYFSESLRQTLVMAMWYIDGIGIVLLWKVVRLRKCGGKESLNDILWFGVFGFLPVASVVQLIFLLLPTQMPWLASNIYFAVIMLVGLWMWTENKFPYIMWPAYVCGIMAFVSTVMLSNLSVYHSLPYMISGAAIGLILFANVVCDRLQDINKGFLSLAAVAFALIITRGFLLGQTAVEKATIFDTAGVIKQGPAFGVFADYMTAYMYNSNYEEYTTYIQPGDKVLLASDTTIDYLNVQNVEICVSSTISTPTYDENLVEYWKNNPDKYPTVVVVDCWYGETRYPEGTWLGDWLVNEFHADKIVDGKYYRYYIKRRG